MTRIAVLFIFIFSVSCTAVQEKPEELLVDATAEDILNTIASFEGDKPVMINFWATWCIPCIEEFPYIMQLKEQYSDQFELIFVSGDFSDEREDATNFLKEQNVDFTTYMKQGSDNEFISTISDTWTGALPFTVIYDTNGDISAAWEGKAEFEQFEIELLKVLNKG